jgi:hypothetical protein
LGRNQEHMIAADQSDEDGQSPQLPPVLRQVVDTILMSAHETISTGAELSARLVLVKHGEPTISLPIDMGTATEKATLACDIRLLAAARSVDALVLVSEAWRKFDKRDARESRPPRPHGPIEDMPDRIETLLMAVHSPEGHWLALADINGSGLDRRLGELSVSHSSDRTGIFTGLIATPAEVAARETTLTRFAEIIRARGMDPMAPVSEEEGSMVEVLARVMIRNGISTFSEAELEAALMSWLALKGQAP